MPTELTPLQRTMKAAHEATQVDRLHEMPPEKAVEYLNERAAYLDSGNWVPDRANLLREWATRIDTAIKDAA